MYVRVQPGSNCWLVGLHMSDDPRDWMILRSFPTKEEALDFSIQVVQLTAKDIVEDVLVRR